MANLRHYFMAANNMSTEDTSRIAAKKARAESKKMQYEKRLELEQKQELIRQRGRRTIKAGFSFMALGLCTLAYTYYTKPLLVQNEIENFKKVIAWRPTSGPSS